MRLADRAKSNFVFVLLLLLDQLDEVSLAIALSSVLRPAHVQVVSAQIGVLVLDLLWLGSSALHFLFILRIEIIM